ncbi:hypothetical protein ACL02T_08195 [Pseudonocardia sp. RS010]|uniref:hypothetical protein n=1 Tax=Pseudonocardia sp. RS010 TaxID=3385979 RepID=UPI0039A396C6
MGGTDELRDPRGAGERRDEEASARDEAATQRDEASSARDGDADYRDRNARDRDARTSERLHGLVERVRTLRKDILDRLDRLDRLDLDLDRPGQVPLQPGSGRPTKDVRPGAEDRAALEALLDEVVAVLDREAAVLGAAANDRWRSARDRRAAAEDRRDSAADRDRSAADREEAAIDRERVDFRIDLGVTLRELRTSQASVATAVGRVLAESRGRIAESKRLLGRRDQRTESPAPRDESR